MGIEPTTLGLKGRAGLLHGVTGIRKVSQRLDILRALGYRKGRSVLRGADARLWFEDLVVLADVVADRELSGVCDDPDDDKYLAAALEGRTSHVVTGDRRFLALGEHAGVEIVTPRAFLDLLGS